MRIAVNALSALRGGGQTYLMNLLNLLGYFPDSQIFVLAPTSLTLPNDPRISRLQINLPSGNPFIRALWEKFVLPRALVKLEADILFCPGGLVNTPKIEGCKTVTMFRNMIPFDVDVRKMYPLGRQRVRNWLLERAMLSSMLRSDLVIFISDYARHVIEGRLHGLTLNAVTIPHGISDHFRVASDNRPPKPDWLPTGEYLLYVSLFEVYKHQMEVVRGYHLLKSRRPTPEKLILAGHLLEPVASKVRAEIARLGLLEDVILPGNIPYRDLPAIYANAKINIFASTCENCPNILLEAMGAGRPLLVSDQQPMPEFAGEAAIYFDATSPEDFSNKLEGIIDDNQRLDILARLAVEQSRRFNWNETAKRTWSAISELGSDLL